MRSITFRKHAFTLIELLLVVGIMGALSAIVISAVNPRRQLSATTGAGKLVAAKALQAALNQYLIDTGSFPDAVKLAGATSEPFALPICPEGVTNALCINVDPLTVSKRYLNSIPSDDADPCDYSSGYAAYLANGRVNVKPMYPEAMPGELSTGLCDNVVAFTGAGSDFTDGQNWEGGAVPGADDTVTIPAGKTVVLDGASSTTAQAQLLAAGTLEVYVYSLAVVGQLTISNATLYIVTSHTGQPILGSNGQIIDLNNPSQSSSQSSANSSAGYSSTAQSSSRSSSAAYSSTAQSSSRSSSTAYSSAAQSSSRASSAGYSSTAQSSSRSSSAAQSSSRSSVAPSSSSRSSV